MSGGVDSSVSAALLKERGFDVTGVFIKVWQPDFLECTWIDERRDAMRVAAQLEIPFITIDLEEEYKKGIVEYMIAEYREGRTPNPDVMCNQEIKFGAFLNMALSAGADYVATGHYARIASVGSEESAVGGVENIRYKLLKGVDDNKDQSYFLWTLPKEKLSKILFPIGEFKKDKVRELAKKYKLPTAKKKDSQGLCFIGKLDMKDFLKHYIEEKRGKVINSEGEEIGEHDGAFFYTLGERHGFKITKKGTSDRPLYIIDKNIESNTITVSESPLINNAGKKTYLRNTNWIQIPNPRFKYSARARYRQNLVTCTVGKDEKDYFVEFRENVILPAGQSIVIYDGNICLGGGVIS